jgi:hypothetical protein
LFSMTLTGRGQLWLEAASDLKPYRYSLDLAQEPLALNAKAALPLDGLDYKEPTLYV